MQFGSFISISILMMLVIISITKMDIVEITKQTAKLAFKSLISFLPFPVFFIEANFFPIKNVTIIVYAVRIRASVVGRIVIPVPTRCFNCMKMSISFTCISKHNISEIIDGAILSFMKLLQP